MSQILQQFLSALGKFFLGILAKQRETPAEEPTPTPIPLPTPAPTPAPAPLPQPIDTRQSKWWNGVHPITQPYGCTHYSGELHNPNHPNCDYWHDGIDFGMPCGTPLYAPGDFQVGHVDDPSQVSAFGTAALALFALKNGKYQGHTVWLLHMQDYAVKFGWIVKRGDLLGHSGTRGRSTGCHLHFMVTPLYGNYFSSIDPAAWVTMSV